MFRLAQIHRFAAVATIAAVLALAASSCRRQGEELRRLTAIEPLLEHNPDSARVLLDGIDPTGFRGESLALYALLKTQADYKCYVDIPSDSLIRKATAYYGTRRKGYHSAMSWYSLGCVSASFGCDSAAADAYLTSMRLFPDTLVRYYALAEQNLSYIFLDRNMYSEAMSLIKSCRANAVRLNDSAAIAFCEYNTANILLYKNELDSARKLFLALKDNIWLSPDTKDEPLLQLSKISSLFKDYKSSIEYADSFIIRNNHSVPYGAAYSVKADAFFNLGQLDSALCYYKLSLTDTSDPFTICEAHRRLTELYSRFGNSSSAADHAKLLSSWTDSIIEATYSNDIYSVLYSKRSIQTPSNSLFITYFPIFFLIILLISTGLIVFFRKKHIWHFPSLGTDIDNFKKGTLYNRMCKIVRNQTPPSPIDRSQIEIEYHNSLTGLRNSIKASGMKLNEMDVDYCIFSLLGFKQKDFHLFFPISYSGSRNLKMRMKEKLPRRLFKRIFG